MLSRRAYEGMLIFLPVGLLGLLFGGLWYFGTPSPPLIPTEAQARQRKAAMACLERYPLTGPEATQETIHLGSECLNALFPPQQTGSN
jgi:hypothetical protein